MNKTNARSKKALALLLAVVMWFTLIPVFTLTVFAASGVPYLDENGAPQICPSALDYTGQTSLTAGWYVVSGTQTTPGRITVSGDAHLILADGCHLDAQNGGIGVSRGNSLTIYAQSEGVLTGKLTAVGGGGGDAGIGGNDDLDSGIVVINGGEITATGGTYAAGIGGGRNASNGYLVLIDGIKTMTGGIVINGGVVTAYGGIGAAGIGGSASEGNTFVWNDEIELEIIVVAPGGAGGNITIRGGTVNAYGGGGDLKQSAGAGIGSGGGHTLVGDSSSGDAGSILITGSADVNATGGNGTVTSGSGAGIGSGGTRSAEPGGANNIIITTTGAVTAVGGTYTSIYYTQKGAGIGAGSGTSDPNGQNIGTEYHIVAYNLNGGTGAGPAEPCKAEGDTFTVAVLSAGVIPADSDPLCVFIPSLGKQFEGWNTMADGTGTAYAPGDTIVMPGGNFTLYAVWEGAAASVTGPFIMMALTEGYAATYTGAYTITGFPIPIVDVISEYAEITWNDTEKRLDIASGLTAGVYSAVIAAYNGIIPSGQLNFMLIVTAPPTDALTGTATIDNISPRIGDILTGSLVGGNNTGTLSYEWKASGVQVGTGASYTVKTADLGKEITLEITSSVETGAITSAATAAILKKATPVASGAPMLESKTHNSVTLTHVAGYEYSMDGTTWQMSNVFGGLNPSTAYTFYQRIAETADNEASAASAVLDVTTDAAPSGALTGTATIDIMNPRIGDILTGSLADGSSTGTLSYDWRADGVSVGTGVSYTVTAADLGKEISLEITSDVESGTVTSGVTAAVLKKAAPAVPDAPTLVSKTHISVTLTANTAYEFSKDGVSWQTSNVFGGLNPNTAYTFYQRIATTADTEASAASIGLNETTNATPPNALVGTATISNTNPRIGDILTSSFVGSNNTGTLSYEWKAGGVPVGTGASYTVKTADLGKEITLEIMSDVETGTIASTTTAAVLKKTAPAVPDAPTLASKTHNNVTLTANPLYEFSKDGVSWQTSNVFGGLNPSTAYTFYQRIAETADTLPSAASPALNEITNAAPPIIYTITFDANGGNVSPTTAQTGADGKLSIMPTPTRSGSYRFDGWFTAASGGTQVTTNYEFTANTTIFAQWAYTGGNAGGSSTGGGGGGALGNPSGTFSSGNNVYAQGTNADIIYIVNKDFSLFSYVRVGSSTLTQNRDYRAESGSTIIILLPAYLDTLEVGSYTMTVGFKDNTTATAIFTVVASDTPDDDTQNPDTGAAIPFDDVSASDWFANPVMWAYINGYMVGTAPTLFSPQMTTTRAMIVTILYRQAGEPSVAGLDNPFIDVPEGQWYSNAVIWAASKGIVTGYGDGLFGTNDNITRQDLACILARYADFAGLTLPVLHEYAGFLDDADIANYAKDAVERLFEAGIIGGKPGNIFDPKGNATRAEVAAMLMRFLEAME